MLRTSASREAIARNLSIDNQMGCPCNARIERCGKGVPGDPTQSVAEYLLLSLSPLGPSA